MINLLKYSVWIIIVLFFSSNLKGQPAKLVFSDGSEKLVVIESLDHQVISHELSLFDYDNIDKIVFHSEQERFLKRYERLKNEGVDIVFDSLVEDTFYKTIDESFIEFSLIQREVNLLLKNSDTIETSFVGYTFLGIITSQDTIPFKDIELAEFSELYSPFYYLYTRLYFEKIKVIYYKVNERPWTFRPKKISKVVVNDNIIRFTDSTRSLVKDRGYMFGKIIGDKTEHVLVFCEAANYGKKIDWNVHNPNQILVIRPQRFLLEITTKEKLNYYGYYMKLNPTSLVIENLDGSENEIQASNIKQLVFKKALYGASSGTKIIKTLAGGVNLIASVYTRSDRSIVSKSDKIQFGDLEIEVNGREGIFEGHRNLFTFLLPDKHSRHHLAYKNYGRE